MSTHHHRTAVESARTRGWVTVGLVFGVMATVAVGRLAGVDEPERVRTEVHVPAADNPSTVPPTVPSTVPPPPPTVPVPVEPAATAAPAPAQTAADADVTEADEPVADATPVEAPAPPAVPPTTWTPTTICYDQPGTGCASG